MKIRTLSKTGRFAALVAAAALLMFARQQAHAQNAAKTQPVETPAAANAENGKRLYTSYGCYECHGREGQGSPVSGARLAPRPIELRYFIAYVRQPSGQMPPYTAKVVSDAELADIRAFLNTVPQPPPAKSIPLLN
ncbi:MAG: cytochrome c [Acidobacteriia bacterium]|nr:cytochrome c [Terriglobia bacterium]